MKKVVGYQDGSSTTREACAWIAQLDGDVPPSPQDLTALKEWMVRSPAHREEITRLAGFWGHMGLLTELASVPKSPAQPPKFEKRRTLRYASALAAGVLLLVGGLFLGGLLMPPTGGVAYRTAVGEQRRVVLPDGSGLLLNTDSVAVVQLDERQRHVRLERGEAHFEVSPDTRRPFLVEAGDGWVRAVGTAFSVRRHGAGAKVSVTEGKVEVSIPRPPGRGEDGRPGAGVRSTLLHAGQQVQINSTVDAVVDLAPADMARDLAWRDGLLIFEGERLDRVIQEVNRYTVQPIGFGDPALGSLRIGGQFRIGDTEALFRALEEGFGVRVERTGQRVWLSSAVPVQQ